MRHSTYPDKSFEVVGNELWAIITDDPWTRIGVFLLRKLNAKD
jgi:hypothetical protein